MPGSAYWHEDHVSLDVARAFALHAYISGDYEFLRDRAWPVLAGVSKWIKGRATRSNRGYEIRSAMGIAERKHDIDNSAFTNMSAVIVLRDAIAAAQRLNRAVDPAWTEIAAWLCRCVERLWCHTTVIGPMKKRAAPDPLMGIFPLGYPLEHDVKDATLEFIWALPKTISGAQCFPPCTGCGLLWRATARFPHASLKMATVDSVAPPRTWTSSRRRAT